MAKPRRSIKPNQKFENNEKSLEGQETDEKPGNKQNNMPGTSDSLGTIERGQISKQQDPNILKANERGRPNISLIKKMQEERLKKKEILNKANLKNSSHVKDSKLNQKKEKILEDTKLQTQQPKKNEYEEKLSRKVERMCLNRRVKKEAVQEEKVPERSEKTVDESLKNPICCILGHVDTGKTKILDKLRESNVQESEAGGITQQIGATYFPSENLKRKYKIITKLPGILIIDTPGHESFSNLRYRGSSLCNLAILVVDIFHLLEPQTMESIEILRLRRIPFVVALNKVDKIHSWKPCSNTLGDILKDQNDRVKQEFKARLNETVEKFAILGLNARLYSENPDPRKFISLVPTSAITGEGLPNLIDLVLKMNEKFMAKKNTYSDDFKCVVLEVNFTEGFGHTIDVILVNGSLCENDKICINSFDGPIITKIKCLLVPQPLKEIRIKTPFKIVKVAKASLGIKIAANNLEQAIPGTEVHKITDDGEANKLLQEDMKSILNNVKTQERGVHVTASTLGSLEALVLFLDKEKIPIFSFSVGSVKKSDIIKISTMKKYALILCFDVRLEKELADLASLLNVKIFEAKIIYHILDKYKAYMDNMIKKEKEKHIEELILPCSLKILPNCLFTKRTPLVLGVKVLGGKLKVGTPIFVNKNRIEILGTVTSIEDNRKNIQKAIKDQEVAIKIEANKNDPPKVYGKHFDQNDIMYSMLSRKSIDTLKLYFREEVDNEDLGLIVEIKNILDII